MKKKFCFWSTTLLWSTRMKKKTRILSIFYHYYCHYTQQVVSENIIKCVSCEWIGVHICDKKSHTDEACVIVRNTFFCVSMKIHPQRRIHSFSESVHIDGNQWRWKCKCRRNHFSNEKQGFLFTCFALLLWAGIIFNLFSYVDDLNREETKSSFCL